MFSSGWTWFFFYWILNLFSTFGSRQSRSPNIWTFLLLTSLNWQTMTIILKYSPPSFSIYKQQSEELPKLSGFFSHNSLIQSRKRRQLIQYIFGMSYDFQLLTFWNIQRVHIYRAEVQSKPQIKILLQILIQ